MDWAKRRTYGIRVDSGGVAGGQRFADNLQVTALPSNPADPEFFILPTGAQLPIQQAIAEAGGWLGFDRFMDMALYLQGVGYYAHASRKFGLMPQSGSDFATAPEMSPHFGRALASQVLEALNVTGTSEVWEFGAGSGALAEQLLQALGDAVGRYTIVDLSGSLRERQQLKLAAFGSKVRWITALPAQMQGVVVGNEVLDAMPAKLLVRKDGRWLERGVALHEGRFVYADQVTALRPPFEIEGGHDYLTEIHPQAEGFVRTLADRLTDGAIFLLDYGFPEHEYYHPQRSMGTLMCHRAHLADTDALADAGEKDITVHVNFTGIALAGQEAGLRVAGYTGQGRFLLNCGLLDGADDISLPERVMLQRLVNEHEMGELFKVIAFVAAGEAGRQSALAEWVPRGFVSGDRMHML